MHRRKYRPVRQISIHALLAESDSLPNNTALSGFDFYPRSPCGERLNKNAAMGKPTLISIHALLAESDQPAQPGGQYDGLISIHALLAESDLSPKPKDKSNRISIHALLAESDRALRQLQSALRHFYPRSPCGERQHAYQLVLWVLRFLSTLSLRRATVNGGVLLNSFINFYPRSPCGERLAKVNSMLTLIQFLSTLSLRRATTWARGSRVTYVISIHALLAESDTLLQKDCHHQAISIHALLAESDRCRGR